MSQKISDLAEITRLDASSSSIANLMVDSNDGSKKVSFETIKKSMVSDYPYNDAVELDYTWDDLYTMTGNGDYPSDLKPGDYKTVLLLNGETVIMEVAGIDTHYNMTTGHHIDFISRYILKDTVAWNTEGNNNGTENQNCPYLASSLYEYLNGEVYSWLPNEIKNVIAQKKEYLETRYTAGSTSVAVSNGKELQSLGYVWLPSEVEVFGHVSYGTKKWTEGSSVQYPIFADGVSRRVKTSDTNGWWTCCAYTTSTQAVSVSFQGEISFDTVTKEATGVPLCFRVAKG
jgi:hypothetical protein